MVHCVSLHTLSKLKEKYPDFIDVRIADYPLSFGAFAVDIDSAKGKIYLEQYRYQMPGEDDIPKMLVEPVDGMWYELYKKQIKVLWKNATPFQKS